MDKMNLFGMPFRRLVWIDADMFVRRNVDEICELPDDVPFASTLDAEGKPTHCWPKRATCPGTCSRDYSLVRESKPYVGLRVPELMPPPQRCSYIIQSGVMMLQPLNLSAFNELIVQPVSHGLVSTYDSGDQGIISTLMYGKARLFGDAYMRLHPMYNVIARHAKHTEHKWGGGAAVSGAALLHFTRETRPWQQLPQMNNVTRIAEWTLQCGDVLCYSLAGHRRKSAPNTIPNTTAHAGATHLPPPSIGLHPAWYGFCNASAGHRDTLSGR